MSRDDENQVLNAMMQLALQLLDQQGEFYPFGALLTQDGQVRMVAGSMGAEHPRPSAVLERVESGLREEIARSNPRAAGVCLLVRIRDPRTGDDTPAVQARVEDAEGDALHVYLPYRRGDAGQLQQGQRIGGKGARTLFPPNS